MFSFKKWRVKSREGVGLSYKKKEKCGTLVFLETIHFFFFLIMGWLKPLELLINSKNIILVQ